MWARGYSLINIQHEIEIASEAAVNWASYCREICLISFVDNPEQLGGVGKTVEIDMFYIKLISIPFPRKKVFAAAEEAGNVERNDSRRFTTVTASEASTTAAKHGYRVAKTFPAYLRSSTKTVFPAQYNFFKYYRQ